jgi:anti-sigma regulatory factor (Ser/Thr protein kinase)
MTASVGGQARVAATPGTRLFDRSYAGEASQVGLVRSDLAAFAAGCPVLDDLVLMASELAANAVQHSRSGEPGGRFTVQAGAGGHAWLEVEDQGGPWSAWDLDSEHGRGLSIVAALAGDGNWGVDNGHTDGPHTVWACLKW